MLVIYIEKMIEKMCDHDDVAQLEINMIQMSDTNVKLVSMSLLKTILNSIDHIKDITAYVRIIMMEMILYQSIEMVLEIFVVVGAEFQFVRKEL